jgi:DNA-binding winged helix-turn-helix (wHTH) protein/TolB-like protein
MPADAPPTEYRFGRFLLQPAERLLLVDGRSVPVGARPFDLLVALVESAGHLVTKEQLLERVWPNLVVEENNLQVQVSTLRKILGNDAIVTIPGRGYRFTVPLEPTIAPAADRTPDTAPAAPGPDPGPEAPTRPAPPARPTWKRWAVSLLALVLLAVAIRWLWPTTEARSTPPALSLAVVPFKAETADTTTANALSRELTTVLGRSRWHTVASQVNASAYAGRTVDHKSVGRDLNVRYIVDGEIARSGGKFVATVHLVDAESGANTWTDRLEFDGSEAPDTPNAPAMRLGQRLWTAVYEAEMRRATARAVPGSPWDLVLKGDALIGTQKGDPKRMRAAARKLYDEALRIDPRFVPALVSVAWVDRHALWSDVELNAAQRRALMNELDKVTADAVLIDPLDPSTWFGRSHALAWLGRFDEAHAAVRRAVALNPTSAVTIAQDAYLSLVLDRPEDALRLAEYATTMERGVFAEEAYGLSMLCGVNLMLGRYAQAVQACEQSAAQTNNWDDYLFLAAGYAQLGQTAKAASAKAELLKQKPNYSSEQWRNSDPGMSAPSYARRVELHLYSGLSKAGLSDQ